MLTVEWPPGGTDRSPITTLPPSTIGTTRLPSRPTISSTNSIPWDSSADSVAIIGPLPRLKAVKSTVAARPAGAICGSAADAASAIFSRLDPLQWRHIDRAEGPFPDADARPEGSDRDHAAQGAVVLDVVARQRMVHHHAPRSRRRRAKPTLHRAAPAAAAALSTASVSVSIRIACN